MTREQQQRTKIKICGLKRPEDITYVNEAKSDYCGFIIEFPKSSRKKPWSTSIPNAVVWSVFPEK